MTTTKTLFNGAFAVLALAGVLMASAPASAGLSDRVDAIASAETANTSVQDEITASAEPRATEAATASKGRSPRHDSDVTARRHTQAKPAPARHVERIESRKPRFSWHAASYAAATPIGFGRPCHRR
jgi:hypothetical protein